MNLIILTFLAIFLVAIQAKSDDKSNSMVRIVGGYIPKQRKTPQNIHLVS
jgi:hypothetical protein